MLPELRYCCNSTIAIALMYCFIMIFYRRLRARRALALYNDAPL